MLFDIYSREEMEKRIRQGRKFENTAIISFYDTVDCTPIDYTGICDDVFYVKMDDLDSDDLDKMGITKLDYFPDVDKLARFIIKEYSSRKAIICQCEYGQGRSAGCLAAIKEYYFDSGIDIFSDELYTPNKIIFNMLLEALKCDLNDLRLPTELKSNEDAKRFNLALKEHGYTPMAYCLRILYYTYRQIENAGHRLDCIRFFFNRQCKIYMKNKTMVMLDCDMCEEQIVLPDFDEIEYIRFYDCVPVLADDFDIFSYGVENASGIHGFEFDSIGGVIDTKGSYDGVFAQGEIKSADSPEYRRLWRECDEVSNCYLDHKKYWRQNYTDALVGAFAAEGILLSNDGTNTLEYGENDYISKVAKLPTPPKKVPSITNKNFYERCNKLCRYMKLEKEDSVFAAFVYTYIHSLLRGSHCENFSIIRRTFNGYFQKYGDEGHNDVYNELMKYNFYNGEISIGSDKISQLKMAIGVIAKTNSYAEALEMLLELTGADHKYHLAFCLLGAFAGVYYQHYRIPVELLKNCPYYDRFKDKILPFDDPSYNGETGE